MKIYFAGSIRGGREDVKIYSEIINYLRKYGEVLTEHVADPTLIENGEQNLSDKEIHDRDMDWLNQSEVLVAEVSVPSLGVGYEIRAAVELQKKILCLYRLQKDKNLSAMIGGNPEISVGKYNQMDEAIKIINDFFQENQLSTR
ncbi:MAG: nucleoside 2-deoxyribosyltransferase [Bacteroidales bacterium]|nr:nucleoside 2-deoxyribosyltransferase [Bacteroidales bacterium]